MYGYKTAPSWVVDMDIAKSWHIPPYKLTGGTKLLWYVRSLAVREYEIKRSQKKDKP